MSLVTIINFPRLFSRHLSHSPSSVTKTKVSKVQPAKVDVIETCMSQKSLEMPSLSILE